MFKYFRLIKFTLILSVSSVESLAGTLTFDTPESGIYLSQGEPANKAGLVFIAEGYRLSEMPKFHNDVIRAVNYLFTLNPFKDRKKDFNIYWVNSVSSESGSDNASVGLLRDTAFDSRYSGRLITVLNHANIVIAKSKVPESEIVIVLVNHNTYGGSGTYNGISVSYNGGMLPQVASHEVGHSFGILADEYQEFTYNYLGSEPPFANFTKLNPPQKWSDLLGFGGVSGFQGGMRYYKTGVFRPTGENCQMRRYTNTFCNVCLRALNRRIGLLTNQYAPEVFSKAKVTYGEPPLSVQFTGYATDGDSQAFTYAWKFGSATSAEQNPTHIFETAGTYPITLTGTDENGRQGNALPFNIIVNRRPSTPSIPNGPALGTIGTNYAFSTVGTDGDGHSIKYTVDWGDGKYTTSGLFSSGTEVVLNHSWAAPGSYKIRAYALDSMGWGSSWSATRTIVIE